MKLKNACQSSMNLFIKNDQSCVVPENIYTPHGGQRKFRGEGGAKKTQFPRGWGQLLEIFFPGLRVRLVSYQKLTAALLSKLSVTLLLTLFQNKNHCFHR